jgi:hypothetical protein
VCATRAFGNLDETPAGATENIPSGQRGPQKISHVSMSAGAGPPGSEMAAVNLAFPSSGACGVVTDPKFKDRNYKNQESGYNTIQF